MGHIIGVLGFRKVGARWVLSEEKKAERVCISRELLEHFKKEGEDFLKKIITGDETWVHHYDPENKRQSVEYCHKESPQPKRFKTQASAGKVMLTVFWNSECVVLADFHEKETTINSQRYIEALTALKRRIERTGIRNETLLQLDNARPHTIAATRDAMQRLDFSVLPHLPYNPDLAPSNFHLFPKLKERLKGQCFSCDEDVKSAVRKWFQKRNTNFFKDVFQKLMQCCRKRIEVHGDCVEE